MILKYMTKHTFHVLLKFTVKRRYTKMQKLPMKPKYMVTAQKSLETQLSLETLLLNLIKTTWFLKTIGQIMNISRTRIQINNMLWKVSTIQQQNLSKKHMKKAN